MTCPNCGATIYPGDIACRQCRYPVAMMSGNVSVKTTPVVPEAKPPMIEEVGPVQVNATGTYSPKMATPVQKEQMPRTNKNTFHNYGVGKQAITSPKFLIPIFIGVIVTFFVVYGAYSFFHMIYQGEKEKQADLNLSSYAIDFDKFTLELMGDMTYQKANSKKTLYIWDADGAYEASIQIISATYSSARSRKASLKSYFQSLGYTVSEIEEEKIGSATYLTMNATKNKKQYVLAVTKAGNSSMCFGISLLATDMNQSKQYLEYLSPVFSEAKYQNKVSSDEKVEFDFSEALK